MSRKNGRWNFVRHGNCIFFILQSDDMAEDMKPDVEFSCEEELESPKKSVNKKPHKTRSRGKPARKHNKNKVSDESVNDDESSPKDVKVKDGSSEVESTKSAKTKGKKEKVGKMCQICGQIFKSLQAHLYVHDIYPKFECNVCVQWCVKGILKL